MRNAPLSCSLVVSALLGLAACDDAETAEAVDSGTVGDAGGDAGATDGGLDASRPDSAVPAADASTAIPVALKFKGKVGSADLVCGQNYPGQGTANTTITPRDFRFFVHNVRLITAAGVSVPVTLDTRLPYQSKDVALLDFNDGTGKCDPSDKGTNMVINGTVPPGNYTSIAFTPGVPESLNHGDPALSPGPLQAPGVSWGWLLGYRFVMAEVSAVSAHTSPDAGALDGGTAGHGDDAGTSGHGEGDGGASGHGAGDGGTGGHGAAVPGLGFVHLGSTGCMPGDPITCTKANRPEVKLDNFDFNTKSVVADLGAVFSTADLSTNVQCHGSGPACAPMVEALGVNLDTGAPTATQRVFRVE